MSTELNTTYKVATNTVKLTIIIGDAQLGSSKVELNGALLGLGDIDDLKIGNGPDIVGKTLKVKSVVADVNDQTNKTSITYNLSGGQQDASHQLAEIVANNGDSIVYRAEIKFE